MELIAKLATFEAFASALLASAVIAALIIAIGEMKNAAHRGRASDDDYDWDI